MTQIKLRRDTSANFTSKNPILGAGEPAYETDTKKLKIGDGTTSYTQLEYFSTGGGGSTNIGAALPLKIVDGVISLEVDGQTIQIVDGKLHANLDELGNEVNNLSSRVTAAEADLANKQDKLTAVTTDTAQTITGSKTFKGPIKVTNSEYTSTLADVNTNGGTPYLYLGETTSRMYLQASNPINRMSDGGVEYPIIDTGNLGSYVDGTTITYTNNKLSTSVAGLEVCDIGMALYVDETKGLRRYLNGQIVDINTNTQAFLNRLKQITTLHPSLLCTEEEWQTAKTMSAFGQVGKFVFNYSGNEIVSVRLPRVVNVQGLFDLQNLGMTISAGLPNMSLYTPASSNKYGSQPNVIYKINSTNGTYNNIIITDASGTNKLYIKDDNNIIGNSNTVQQEAIQYPYFIQIATGSETEANIVNTLENVNGFTLLESKYSDKPLYNESWLLSNGQWNAKAVYPTAYEGLQVEYNTEIEVGTTVTLPSGVSYTKRGLSVKLSTETYTDYDFVLNTADETFRLPLKTKLASGKAVVGNGISLGLTDANGNYFGIREGQINPTSASDAYGVPTGSTATDSDYALNNKAWGVTTDPTKSGMELSDSGLYLYYYVGETVQNANLIDAGRIGEQLAKKVDMLQASGAGMPSGRYIDLALGASGSTYTAPANGYFYIKKVAGNDWYYVRMRNDISNIDLFVDAYRTSPLTSVIPAKKGENVYVYYNATGATNVFRFIYAEGSK